MANKTKCPHDDVHYHLNLRSFGNTPLRYLEVTGACKKCGAKMRFRGPAGLSPRQPTVSIDAEELCAPLLFGEDEPTGRELGYSVSRKSIS